MNQYLTDTELINELESRPGLMVQYLAEREQKMMNELMEANKKLVSSEQIKTEFLSNIRNEIINPITGLLELSRNLVSKSENETARQIASMIFDETYKLDFQLRNILASAELEAGEAVLAVSAVDIEALLHGVVDHFDRVFKKKDLKVEFLGSLPSEVLFHTDAEKLSLILSNLVSNAIQFSPKGGVVEISYLLYDDLLHISCRDNGIGISEEDQQEVYSRFTQLDTGSTKAYPGHGLGLSLVKALLEMLGGNLTLESEPGCGSTFTIHIPELDASDETYSAMGNEFLFGSSDEVF